MTIPVILVLQHWIWCFYDIFCFYNKIWLTKWPLSFIQTAEWQNKKWLQLLWVLVFAAGLMVWQGFAVTSSISILRCQFSAFYAFFSFFLAHTCIVKRCAQQWFLYLFTSIVAAMILRTSISLGDSVCVCVGCVAASYVNGAQ